MTDKTTEQWRRAIRTADRQNLARAESKAHQEVPGTYSWWLIWLAKQDTKYDG